MTRTVLLQEIRKMRFDEAYEGWDSGRLTQGQAAELLGRSSPSKEATERVQTHVFQGICAFEMLPADYKM